MCSLRVIVTGKRASDIDADPNDLIFYCGKPLRVTYFLVLINYFHKFLNDQAENDLHFD